MPFPKEFVWGAATAAYQIEGGAYEDGKGLSVWDVFCRKNGAVKDGYNGDVACDHYHRYEEDVVLMKQIGLQAYRFSIAWPRILPDGNGKVNEKGLDFYDRLVDRLIAGGIVPYVTLFHWDYPYQLYKRGGWLNEDSSCWFADYVKTVVERLSDRVANWFTINEPQCIIALGHQDGTHAPGVKLGLHEIALAAHNLLLAHGKGVQTIRCFTKQRCKIGFNPVVQVRIPDSDSGCDIEAARQSMFSKENLSFWSNAFWLEPVFNGAYPETIWQSVLGKYMPEIKAEDLAIISQPLDFFGMNNYVGTRIKLMNNLPTDVPKVQGGPLTKLNWIVSPEGLYWGPKFCYEKYQKPIMITENGLSNSDWVFCDGKVHDSQRIDFLHRYLRQYLKAAEDGVAVEGYFYWSLMDNFEWAEGYRERFGLIYVDYCTQKRVIKDSGYWYRDIIAGNGESLSKLFTYNYPGL